jgi:predicted DNA-binding transcriptional regulator AlpA
MNNKITNKTVSDECLDNRLIGLKTISTNLGISTRSFWRRVASGDIPPPVRIGRCCRWFESDIRAFKQRLMKRRSENEGGH